MSNPTGPPPAAPAQPLGPGNYDKAWNDPPLFSYSVSAGTQALSSGRPPLNKRVGFPTNHPPPPGHDPTAPPKLHDAGAKPPSSNLPPPPLTTATFDPSPSVVPSTDTSLTPSVPPSLSVEEIEAIFTQLANSYLKPSRAGDITKRLAIMFTAWREEKLNTRVQTLVTEIGTKMNLKDIRGAEESFVVLSADYGGEVGAQWVLALRHVLTAIKEQSSELTVEAVTKPL